MSLSQLLKVGQYALLRGAGINVLPEQIGLKEPSSSGLFGSILGQQSGVNGVNGYTPPTAPKAPTPPADSTDAAANTAYQQAVAVYQADVQTYQVRMMQVMLQQFQMMQLRAQQQQAQQQQATRASSALDSGVSGIGGILDS
ncbi:MAG: hypothetical protein QE263_03410 [Vampirovibrionales bacterium]|nr:hypothetical protein [Vampirovibrionales bacterium]